MNPLREAVLARLAASHAPLSGDRMAGELGISRAAVWKHIEALRQQGLDIASHPGQGYVLQSDVLQAGVLEAQLRGKRLGHPCRMLEQVDSTNLEAMRLAEGGAAEGLVLLAERQQHGRGRLGRSWHTAPQDTLAMSIILRPPLTPDKVPQLSLVAAVGVHDALSAFAPDVRIKWPNDLLHRGAKVAGILTEMWSEPGVVHAVITGIGVNVRRPEAGWPKDIAAIATDLSSAAGRKISRTEVAARVIECLEQAYLDFLSHGFAPIRQRWWQAHLASGQNVRVHDGREYIEGIAQSLDDDGALLLATAEGVRRIIAGDLEVLA
ncbi:MAG: biotin--[acetyl-CoA-carboxylase] ligase [Mariprofundaceae bacterium]